jgi:hypothetical protein
VVRGWIRFRVIIKAWLRVRDRVSMSPGLVVEI